MLKPMQQDPALTDRVRERLLEAIVDGSLRPGERLAQAQIAQSLGVSRQPVSHALSVLKEQGIVVELGRKGLTVAPIEAQHVRHLYQVRAALDALAARLAAENVASDNVSKAQIKHLLASIENASDQDFSSNAQVNEDIDFHRAIYALSGNPVLEEIARPQWVQFRRCMLSVLADDEVRAGIWIEHRDIAQAIADGDSNNAALAAQRHAQRAGESTAVRLDIHNNNAREKT